MRRPVAKFEDKNFVTKSLLLYNFFAYCYKDILLFSFLGTNGIYRDTVKSLDLLQCLARQMNW